MDRRGLTLVELLVAMAIAGVVLLLLTQAVIGSTRYSHRQSLRLTAQEDLRLAFLRLNEVGGSAAYIYPEIKGSQPPLILPDGTHLRTLKKAVAFLVPKGTTYCPDESGAPRGAYCLFVYYWEKRVKHVPPLGPSRDGSGWLLVEARVRWVSWPINQVPRRDFSGGGYRLEKGVVLESLYRDNSDLTNDVRIALADGLDSQLYKYGDVMGDGRACNKHNHCHRNPRVLLSAVRPRITIRYKGDASGVTRSEWIVPRLIPRAVPPEYAE